MGSVTSTSGQQDRGFMDELLSRLGTDFTWVLDWVADNVEPDEIYDDARLGEWAEENGYVKEQEANNGNNP